MAKLLFNASFVFVLLALNANNSEAQNRLAAPGEAKSVNPFEDNTSRQAASATRRPAIATQSQNGTYEELSQLLSSQDVKQQTFSLHNVSGGWWQPMVSRELRPGIPPRLLTLEETLVLTLRHAKQIKVFSDLPMIRETSITEADAAFDWSAFLDSRWDDTSDPVGNSLTAGAGISRFRDHIWSFNGGARKRTRSGGTFELSQQFGAQWNNSQFFVPNQQGTSRLVLNFTQPLMRGRGRIYNSSLTVLAQLDKEIADDEFNRQLQSHLLQTVRAYWALYLERGTLLQKLNSYVRAKEIVRRLEKRSKVDAAESQIASAQASLKERLSDLTRARAAMKNAEARLRSLANAPDFATYEQLELIPVDQPNFNLFAVEMRQSFEEAMIARPEVTQAIRQIKSGSIRANMSKHELMPVLNLVTQTYVAGLEDDNDFGTAWRKQFDRGEPGYSIGLQFEIPMQNRAARARNQRRLLELRQLRNKYLTTLETVRLEVEVAVREVNTTQQELLAKEAAMSARSRQLDYLTRRWERLPGENVSASLMLENLLNAQVALAESEYEFLQSQMTYNLSLTNLKRATGVLLRTDGIDVMRTMKDGLPTYELNKSQIIDSPVTEYSDAQIQHEQSNDMMFPPSDLQRVPEQNQPVFEPIAPPSIQTGDARTSKATEFSGF